MSAYFVEYKFEKKRSAFRGRKRNLFNEDQRLAEESSEQFVSSFCKDQNGSFVTLFVDFSRLLLDNIRVPRNHTAQIAQTKNAAFSKRIKSYKAGWCGVEKSLWCFFPYEHLW